MTSQEQLGERLRKDLGLVRGGDHNRRAKCRRLAAMKRVKKAPDATLKAEQLIEYLSHVLVHPRTEM
jgi:hypothetical protein